MRISVLLCAVLLCASAYAQQVGELISGQVTKVVGGDTFYIGSQRIHIWGIGVPDRWAACMLAGAKWKPKRDSTSALKDCLRGTTVTCRVQRVERRRLKVRFVSECWRDDYKEDVGGCMVHSGWAADYPGYSGGHYAHLETEPKATRRGLWQCEGGLPVRRWCKGDVGVACEAIYKPRGPN
jgi:endonuclease YncB( thermonuclease family)